MSITAASLMVRVGADTAAAEAGIARVAQMLLPGGALALGIAAAATAAVGIGVAATKMAGDFQAGMASIVTGAGESQSNLQLISDGVLQIAKDTGSTTQQLVSGLYMIESGGYRGQKALDILRNAAEGAKVGAADLGTVADATDTILKNFGEHGMTSATAVNTLIATVANGKTHMEDLASSLSGVLPTAAAVGVSLNDVMAAMATMTGEGVDAANASTYLRQTLLALTAPAPKAVAALKSVGLTTQQVSDAMKTSLPGALELITDAVGKKFPVGSAAYVGALKDIAGGSKQIQGMLDLTGQHLATFKSDVDLIGGAAKKGGSAINGWALVQSTFNQKMDRAKEVVQTFFISLGTHLLPVATQLAGMFADGLPAALDKAGSFFRTVILPVVRELADIFTSDVLPVLRQVGAAVQSELLPALAQLWAVLAPGLDKLAATVGPQIVPALRLLGAVFKNVVGPVLVFIIGLVAHAVVILATLISAGVRIATEVPAAFNRLRAGVEGAIAGIQQKWTGLQTAVTGALTSIQQGIGSAVANVVGWFNQWKGVIEVVAGVLALVFGPALIQSGIQAVTAGAQITASFIKNVIATGTEATIAGAKTTGSFIAGMAKAGIAAVVNGAKVTASFVTSLVTTGVEAVRTGALMTAKLIPAILSAAAEFAVAAAGGIASAITGLIGYAAAGWAAAAATIAATWPILAVIAGLALLVVGIKFAIDHWSQITAAVGVAGGVLGRFKDGVLDGVGTAFQGLGAIVGGVFAGIESIIKGYVNIYIGLIDFFIRAINGISIHVPKIDLPGGHSLGGNDLSFPHIPEIPMLANGGRILSGGWAVVGEHGAELAHLPGGSRVFSNPESSRMLAGAGGGSGAGQPIVIHQTITLDGRVLARSTVKHMPDVLAQATGVRSV